MSLSVRARLAVEAFHPLWFGSIESLRYVSETLFLAALVISIPTKLPALSEVRRLIACVRSYVVALCICVVHLTLSGPPISYSIPTNDLGAPIRDLSGSRICFLRFWVEHWVCSTSS